MLAKALAATSPARELVRAGVAGSRRVVRLGRVSVSSSPPPLGCVPTRAGRLFRTLGSGSGRSWEHTTDASMCCIDDVLLGGWVVHLSSTAEGGSIWVGARPRTRGPTRARSSAYSWDTHHIAPCTSRLARLDAPSSRPPNRARDARLGVVSVAMLSSTCEVAVPNPTCPFISSPSSARMTATDESISPCCTT